MKPINKPMPPSPPPQHDLLIQEVNEAVRRDRLEALWKKYSLHLMVAVLLVVGGVGGAQFWSYGKAQRQKERALAYHQALEALETDPEKAEALLGSIIERGGRGYAGMASLQRSAAMLEAEKTKEAYAAYRQLAANKNIEPAFREMGLVLAAYLAFDEGAEAAWQEEMAGEVNGYLKDGATPVYPGLLREWLAVYHLRAKRYAEARQALEGILSDPQTPSGLMERADKLMAQVELHAPEAPPETPEEADDAADPEN